MVLIPVKETLVFSKKYYAGGEVVVELITPDNTEINTTMAITFKKGVESFVLGRKYKVVFEELD